MIKFISEFKRDTMANWKKSPIWYYSPLLFFLLFVNKPFHIDDTLFINIGRILPWSFLGSSFGDISFLGKIYENLSPYESTHPPLIPYFMKVLGIGSPNGIAPFWLYHLSFLLFPFLTLHEGKRLSEKKKFSPYWAWFLVFSPLFFVNATNIMTDIAMLCFWLGSITSLMYFVEDGGKRHATRTVLYLLCAFFTSYQSVSLIPLMLLYAFVNGERKRKSLALILLPALFFFLYLLIVYRISGFFPFLASTINYNLGSEVMSGMKLNFYLHKAIGVLVFSGVGLMLPTPLLLASLNRRRFLEYVVFASIISFTFFYLGTSYKMFEDYTKIELIVVRFFMLIGAIWLFFLLAKLLDSLRTLPGSRKRASYRLLLAIWFFGVFAFNILFLPYATARYFLPALPPALILLFSRPRFKSHPFPMAVLLSILIVMSVFMAAVDYKQASADWLLFNDIKSKVGNIENLWYSDDAGLALYLGNAGANYLPEHVESLPVDQYVLLTRGLINEKLQQSLQPVETLRYHGFGGMSLFNTEAHAGFYRSFDGFLPLAFTEEVRRAVLLKVNSFMKDFEKINRIHLSSPNYADVRGFYLPNGNLERGIHMHPDAEIAFPLKLQHEAIFTGKIMVPPASWTKEGDGVQFHVGITQEGATDWIWEYWLDPKNHERDQKPVSFELNIPKGTEAIHLKVGPGEISDYRNDSVFWLSLELREKAEP